MAHEFTVPAVDGFPLATQVGGPTGAPVLVLIPGQANSHHWWDGLRSTFEDTYRTVTVDYRGTGGSRGPVERWSTETFARDIADVLDVLGADNAAVYGTSMGGRVAQMLAIDHPERVSCLVLACTAPGGRNAVPQPMDVRKSLSRATPEEQSRVLYRLFYTEDWPHPLEQSSLLGDASMNREEQRAHLRASSKHDAWDRLPAITAPTLVLHGGEDRMTPTANAPLLADRIPRARLEVFPGARHGFFEEFADQVNPVVREFLGESGH